MSKTILITGASSGFGYDMAETFTKGGHQVFASMRNPETRNRAKAESLRNLGAHVIELDVTSDESVKAAVGAISSHSKQIDVVINNAGIGSLNVSEAFTTAQLQEIFDTNVFGIHRVLRAVLPQLRAQGSGLVINIGSVLGRITIPFMSTYGATKFALEALTEGYRYELSPFGVDVVLVQPSAYPTSIFGAAQQPADTDRLASYGEIASIPAKIAAGLSAPFQGPDAPSPHEVTEAIAELLNQKAGTRPSRIIVGQPFGADVLNQAAGAAQAEVLKTLALSFLDPKAS